MEDFRGKFIVIAAGYTDNMTRFIESNPGLKSRFDKVFEFEDFDGELLLDIALNQLSDAGFTISDTVKKSLASLINRMYESKDQYFGNGRSIRKIVEAAIRTQHLRMSELAPVKRTAKYIKSLTIDDITNITFEDKSKPDVIPTLGFRLSN